MARVIRIFRENGLARQRLEQERDADWAIRELLARMTQRLQGCESFGRCYQGRRARLNIAPAIPGRLYVLETNPWQLRCVAQWLSRRRMNPRSFIPTTAGPCAGLSAGQW